MEATTVGYKVSEEMWGLHGRVESGGDLDFPVPCLYHHVHNELDAPLIEDVIQRAIVPLCDMIGFRFTDFGGCCILRDAAVL